MHCWGWQLWPLFSIDSPTIQFDMLIDRIRTDGPKVTWLYFGPSVWFVYDSRFVNTIIVTKPVDKYNSGTRIQRTIVYLGTKGFQCRAHYNNEHIQRLNRLRQIVRFNQVFFNPLFLKIVWNFPENILVCGYEVKKVIKCMFLYSFVFYVGQVRPMNILILHAQ